MKLNLHARIEISLALALLLGSCGGGGVVTRDEVIDIADDAVDASDLGGQIEGLEARLTEVEEKANLNAANIEAAFTNAEADRQVTNENVERYNALKDTTLDRLDAIEARLNM